MRVISPRDYQIMFETVAGSCPKRLPDPPGATRSGPAFIVISTCLARSASLGHVIVPRVAWRPRLTPDLLDSSEPDAPVVPPGVFEERLTRSGPLL